MKTYRVGVVGFAHMHVTSLVKDFHEMGERVRFIGCFDPEPEVPTLTDQHANRRQNVAAVVDRTGMPVLGSVDEVLGQNPDIVIVCCENAWHAKCASQILLRGVHVVLEKPMAATLAQAYAMVRASELGGARLIVNWPSTWFPAIRAAQRLVSEGAIGKPFRFQYRNFASGGPFSYGQTMTELEKSVEWWHRDGMGGGASLDYCCYGACLSRWFLGEDPIAAYGVRASFGHQFTAADDYGAITAKFPSAVAHIEGSWTTIHPGAPNGPIVCGLEGTIAVDQENQKEVRLFKTHRTSDAQIIPVAPLPEGRANIGQEVIHCLDTGDALHPTLDLPVNIGAMMVLDAGLRSSVTRKEESTGSRVYTIGE